MRPALIATAACALGLAGPVRGADGAWTLNNSSTWSLPGNWRNGIIADGVGATGAFINNISANRTITVDGAVASRTLGILNVGDTNTTHAFTFGGSGGGTLTFDNAGNGAQLNQMAFSHNNAFASTLPLVLADSLSISNIAPARALTISGGITGAGNLALATIGAGTLTLNTTAINPSGMIANIGEGSGVVTLSGGIGANVTTITQKSGTSPLVVGTGALTVNAGGTTLANSGAGPLTLTGNVTGSGSLTLRNDSLLDNGIVLSGTSLNHAGAITNRGSGAGSVRIASVIGANVTGLVQDSASSMFVLAGNNTYTSGSTVEAGTLQVLNTAGSGTGTGAVILNDGGTLLNEGTVGGMVVVNDGARLSGNGSVGGVVTNASGGTISPIRDGGTAGATLTVASLAWHGGGTYHCVVTGIADDGAGPGIDYSQIVVQGNLAAIPDGDNLVIRMDSLGETLAFESGKNYSLRLLTYGTATGLDLADITLDLTDFQSGGTWSLTNLNNAVYLVCLGETPTPTQNFWIGSGNWSTAGNWSLGHAPLAGEDVVFDFRSIADCTGDSVNDNLGSLTLAAGYSGTLTFRTKYPGQGAFTNVTITGDCTINGGTVTHLANAGGSTATDRLMLTVQSDLQIGANGRINVDGKGYAAAAGPGGAPNTSQNNVGASHGGLGGAGYKIYGDQLLLPKPTYGDYAEPATLGSGANTRGGGCALIRVDGQARVDGVITASAAPAGWRYAGPAGGSIQLIAGSLAGSGSITASGRGGDNSTDTAGGGGGGRIAVILTNGVTFGSVAISAPGGKDATKSAGAAGTVYLQNKDQGKGEGVLIIDNAPHAISTFLMIGTLMPEPSEYNAAPDLSQLAGLVITNQGLLILNTNTVFDFGAGNLIVGGLDDASVAITGTNGLSFPAAFTVSPNYRLYLNTTVTATGNWTIPGGAVLSHFKNYSTAAYSLGLILNGNLTIDLGGSINVDGCGYKSAVGVAYAGPAAGGTTGGFGSGYGGMGGVSFLNVPAKPTYGSVTEPFDIGSGASYVGNGAVFLDIRGTTTLNGSITSRLTDNVAKTAGSSGGAIWLTTRHLVGNGLIDVSGKPSSYSSSAGTSSGGGGGGGRISVVVTEGNSLDGVQLKAPGGRNTSVGWTHQSGAAGTIYTRTADQNGRGRLMIANDNWDIGLGVATNTLTLLPAPAGAIDKELRLATLAITNLAYVALTSDLTVGDLFIATNAANRLFLKGHTLKVNSFYHKDWGGDDWVVEDGGQIVWRSGTILMVR